ncbi:hypothetical protein [Acetobacter pasteurianus]|uniref:hypothetical protein n=1 Tax=Acetobacter pasteurianus TaxID=438 RepID=UPI003D096029
MFHIDFSAWSALVKLSPATVGYPAAGTSGWFDMQTVIALFMHEARTCLELG